MTALFGIAYELWYLGISIMVPCIMLIILMLYFRFEGKAVKIMYYTTESSVTFLSKKVRDGSLRIGKKLIHVDKVKPIMIRTGALFKGFKPLYIVKWNSALPLYHTKEGTKVMTGENLKNMSENKTLDQLLTPKGGDRKMLLYIILGIVIGIMAGYIFAGYGAK